MSVRAIIPHKLGEVIQISLSLANDGMDCNIILIAFPTHPEGEPAFLTNLPAEVMEETLCVIGAELSKPEMVASRVEKSNIDPKAIN